VQANIFNDFLLGWQRLHFAPVQFDSIWGRSVLLCVWVSFYAPVSAKLIILRTQDDGEGWLICQGHSFLASWI